MKADNSSSRQFSPHLRVVILGLLLILCTSVKASSPGSRHDSAHVAYGRRNARRAEGGDGGNTAASSQTRGASPDADSSTLSTVLFPRTVLANFGFSEPCVEALSATLSCSEAVRQQHYLYTWGGLTESDIETVCTESCAESFEALRANVATACADDVYTDPVIADTGYVYGTGFSNSIYNIESISARPVAIVDYYHLSYKLLCLKDECVQVTTPSPFCSHGTTQIRPLTLAFCVARQQNIDLLLPANREWVTGHRKRVRSMWPWSNAAAAGRRENVRRISGKRVFRLNLVLQGYGCSSGHTGSSLPSQQQVSDGLLVTDSNLH
jgi:hypothetical protein